METLTTASPSLTVGDLPALAVSWRRHLQAENKSPKTIRNYMLASDQLAAFLAENGMPTSVAAISREHVEAFIVDVMQRRTVSTAATRFRGLQQLFRWLVEEGEIASSPMERMRPPKLEEKPIPVIEREDLRALLDACKGRDFADRRDTAILRVFMNTGARLSEVAGAKLEDLDLDHGRLRVRRKGNREEVLPLGAKTIKALDRYLRARVRHRAAYLEELWIGAHGALGDSGIAQMVKRRCREAGIAPINVHRFRHTFAHEMKSKGVRDEDLMTLGGWRSPTMLTRYAKSTATERAADVHFRLAPGEDL